MKKLLFLGSLLGFLFIAMPMRANDIPTPVTPTGMDNVATGSDAAVRILTGSPVAWFDKVLNWQTGTNNATETGIFNFGVLSIDLTDSNAITGVTGTHYSGVHTNAHGGTFNLGAGTINIDVTGGDTIRGFRHLGGTFSGTINGGTDITVIATDSFYATAVGFATSPIIGTGSFQNADITFGNLTAKTLLSPGGTLPGAGSGATTFRSGDFTGAGTGTHVTLGTLTAETEYSGAGVAAIGAHIGTDGSNAIQSGSSLSIAGIDVKSAGSAGGLLLGNATGTLPANLGNSAGDITIGTIDVTGIGESYGIRAKDMANLTLTGDTNVTSTNGTAYGAQIWGNVTGSTKVTGKITAIGGNTGNDGAAGFAAYGANTGTVALGDIEAKGNWAVGAHFTQNVQGNLSIHDINVESGTHEATGLAVGTYAGGTVIPSNISSSEAMVGSITVTSEEANAFGIRAGTVNNLRLRGDIDVTGAGSETSGIRTYGNTAISLLDADVRISTEYTGEYTDLTTWVGADIWTDGNLSIDLRGKNLTTGNVKVDNGRNMSVVGRGLADLGVVHMHGNFTIGDGTNKTIVAIDGERMVNEGGYLGNVYINPVSSLEIFGNTDIPAVIGSLTSGNPSQVVNRSVFTRWGVDELGDIRSFGLRDRVYANDNYLAAAMIHNRYTGWNAVRDHLISGATHIQHRYGYGHYGQAACDCAYGCLPVVGCGQSRTRGAWVNYVGRSSHYQSSYNGNDWKLTTNGAQIGTDFFRTQRNQFGMFFGYEDSTGKNPVEWFLQDRVTAKDYYVGLYGVHVFNGGADLRTVFNFGWQDYTSQRNGTAETLYRSSFRGNTAELNVELGKRWYLRDHFGVWSVRPAIALDWYLKQLGGGRETPTTEQAIRYGKTDVSQLFLRFGSDLRYELGRWAIEGGLFYSYDLRGSDFWARASSVDGTNLHSAVMSSKQGRSVLSLNIGSSYLMGRNFTLFGGYRGEATSAAGKGYENIGYIGGAWTW